MTNSTRTNASFDSSLFAALLFASGCGMNSSSGYQKTHQFARTALPIAVEMERHFGSADHYITYYGLRGEDHNIWTSDVFFGDRYNIAMQVNIRIDYDTHEFEVVGEPVFYLWEVERVSEGGRRGHTREIGRFSKDEWKKVYDSGGDFSTIGITINSEPVPGFEDYVRRSRSPLTPVSLTSGGDDRNE
jgi:hypothetical protein